MFAKNCPNNFFKQNFRVNPATPLPPTPPHEANSNLKSLIPLSFLLLTDVIEFININLNLNKSTPKNALIIINNNKYINNNHVTWLISGQTQHLSKCPSCSL